MFVGVVAWTPFSEKLMYTGSDKFFVELMGFFPGTETERVDNTVVFSTATSEMKLHMVHNL